MFILTNIIINGALLYSANLSFQRLSSLTDQWIRGSVVARKYSEGALAESGGGGGMGTKIN